MQITCIANFIVNIISLLILINATVWEMLLSCFLPHLDKVDASFVGFCVIHRYWPLFVSFAPLCKQGYLLHLVAIVTFCCTAQNTFVLRVFCAVQPKCHTDNVAWLLDPSGTAQEEILLPIRVGKFGSDLLLVSCLNSASWEVSTSLLSHDCVVCFHMLCYLYGNVPWF